MIIFIPRRVGIDVSVVGGLFLRLLLQIREEVFVVPVRLVRVQVLLAVAEDELRRVETESVRLFVLEGSLFQKRTSEIWRTKMISLASKAIKRPILHKGRLRERKKPYRQNGRGGQGGDRQEGDEDWRPQDGRRGRHLGGRWRRRGSC